MSEGNAEEKEKEDSSSTVLYEQLQSEYNKLLKRYAQAENIIDELKTGARVHLYTEPQNAEPNSCQEFEAMHHSQRTNFPCPSQAVVNRDTTKDDTGMNSTGHDLNVHRQNGFSDYKKGQESLPANTKQDDDLVERIQLLKEDVDSLGNYLAESDVASTALNEVSGICKQLDKEHKELRRDFKILKQSRCDSSQSETFHFTGKNGLEKELYKIGIRLGEIQQEVSRRLKSSKTRQRNLNPTQKLEEAISTEDLKPTNQGTSSLDPDLADLVMKLKNLRDSARIDEIKNSSRVDNTNVPPSGESLTSASNRGQPLSSYESHDLVDARYLAASPVHFGNKRDEIGTGSEVFGDHVDYMTFENEEASENIPETADSTRTSGPNDQFWTSQPDRFDSSEASRSQSGSFKYSKRPMNVYDQASFSNASRSSEGLSKPRSSLSDPKDERSHFRENCRPQIIEDSEYEENDLGRKEAEMTVSQVEDERRKSNSLSSLIDSSRMSTPLFHPRGATRVSPQDQRRTKYKRRNASDGFDSGFVGSEGSRSSRMTSESPDIMRKLNLSNPWDSTLHLDLVSEVDENDSIASHDQLSTAYEPLTEQERQSRSSVGVDKTPCDTRESTFANSSPSPPLSRDRTRKPARYFGYSTSRTNHKRSSSDSSLPVSRVQLADPSLSRISERTSSERSCLVERASGAKKDMEGTTGEYSRPGSREAAQNFALSHSESDARRQRKHNNDERRTSSGQNERNSLLALRNEIARLRNQIKNKLEQPQVTLRMFNDIRREDEESRKALERKNDRKLDELRRSIERLTRDFHSRAFSEMNRQQETEDSNSYDSLRSRVKDLTEKLDELSELQKFPQSHPVSPKSPSASFEDDVRDRLSDLMGEVDKLRLRVDNDVTRNIERPPYYSCHLCEEADFQHHGYHPVISERKARTSTPLVTEIYQTSQRQPTLKTENRLPFHHHSSTHPGVQTTTPIIHHIHTYHRTPHVKERYETDSSSEEDLSPRRYKHPKRSLRRFRYEVGRDGSHRLRRPLAQASQAAQDVQRLSKNILNSISLDLASIRS